MKKPFLPLRKSVLAVCFVAASGILAQSCSASKKCGCGTNINKVYEPRRFR